MTNISRKSALSATAAQAGAPHLVDSARKRLNIEPRVPSIRAAIFHQSLNGVLDHQLAARYGCRVEFIRAIIRSEGRALRAAYYALRMEKAA